MVPVAGAGNILGEATTPSGSILNEAMRGLATSSLAVDYLPGLLAGRFPVDASTVLCIAPQPNTQCAGACTLPSIRHEIPVPFSQQHPLRIPNNPSTNCDASHHWV